MRCFVVHVVSVAIGEMSLNYQSFARVLLVLVVYDGFALLQARAVRPWHIGHDIAREFLLFEVIVVL